MTCPSKGVGLSGMIKKACEKNRLSQLQLKGCEKRLVSGFSDIHLTVALWEERRLGLERRTEKVAPVSRRKSISFPSTVRATQGFCLEMIDHVRAG